MAVAPLATTSSTRARKRSTIAASPSNVISRRFGTGYPREHPAQCTSGLGGDARLLFSAFVEPLGRVECGDESTSARLLHDEVAGDVHGDLHVRAQHSALGAGRPGAHDEVLATGSGRLPEGFAD